MSALTFEKLASAIEQEGPCLDPAVYVTGRDGHSSLRRSVEPNGVFAAIVEAGRQLNADPDAVLIRRPLPEDLLDSIPSEDVAGRSLVRIVQGSLRHESGEARDTTFDRPAAGAYYGTCDEAEPSFAATINHMMTGETHYDPYTHSCEIITGENERPVLLRKAVGEQSALSLLPLTVRGITYPAGSIMQYDLGRDYDSFRAGVHDKYPLGKDEIRVATVDDVERINFLRLSAYAVAGGDQRQNIFGRMLYKGNLRDAAEANVLWNFDLEQITDVASATIGNVAQTLR